jgi:hypothetical protein
MIRLVFLMLLYFWTWLLALLPGHVDGGARVADRDLVAHLRYHGELSAEWRGEWVFQRSGQWIPLERRIK